MLWSIFLFEEASFQVFYNACNHACNQYGIHVPFTPCSTPPLDLSKQPLFMFTGTPAGPSEGQQWFNKYRQGRTPFNNLLCLGQYFLLCLAEFWNVLCFTADRWAAVRTRHRRPPPPLESGRLSLIIWPHQQRNSCCENSKCSVRWKKSHLILNSHLDQSRETTWYWNYGILLELTFIYFVAWSSSSKWWRNFCLERIWCRFCQI